MQVPAEISPSDIAAAQARITGLVLRTPLVRAAFDAAPGEIYLKLENLQPIGSFKLRGAANAMLARGPAALASGVWTPSAGNMAQGVAWMARRLAIPCRVVVPETAPRAKLDALRRLGAEIVPVPFETWWTAMLDGEYPAGASGSGTTPGVLVHPVVDAAVIAGNATIGAEILADLPDVDAVLVPFGGGGLITGIASALRARGQEIRVVACEIETAAPLGPSLRAGEPRAVEYVRSFVDGIGSKSILPAMWPHLQRLVNAACTVSLDETCAALRLLVERHHIVAEGAGAVPVAAALSGRAGTGKIACVVSGGNLDSTKLATILAGGTPES